MIYVFCVFPKTSGNASFRVRAIGETNQTPLDAVNNFRFSICKSNKLSGEVSPRSSRARRRRPASSALLRPSARRGSIATTPAARVAAASSASAASRPGAAAWSERVPRRDGKNKEGSCRAQKHKPPPPAGLIAGGPAASSRLSRRRRTKTRSALRTPTWWIQEPGAAVPPGDAPTCRCARRPHEDDGVAHPVHRPPYPLEVGGPPCASSPSPSSA